ncbi:MULTISPECIES: hypothetical protein [Moorena]|uniref:hypothetical protein n=1 Tax=Moorena TaxID=1155738 RepID=UPI00031E843C|nr:MULTISPECIES: hypothetical protein [Moorena]NEP66797.1 hypothetical protein [Moorena sp. SIO3A5]
MSLKTIGFLNQSNQQPVSRQPSAVSRQPSAVSRQPSAVSRQPSAYFIQKHLCIKTACP